MSLLWVLYHNRRDSQTTIHAVTRLTVFPHQPDVYTHNNACGTLYSTKILGATYCGTECRCIKSYIHMQCHGSRPANFVPSEPSKHVQKVCHPINGLLQHCTESPWLQTQHWSVCWRCRYKGIYTGQVASSYTFTALYIQHTLSRESPRSSKMRDHVLQLVL